MKQLVNLIAAKLRLLPYSGCEAQAEYWFSLMQDAESARRHQANFQRWLQGNTQRQAAYQQLEEMWQAMDAWQQHPQFSCYVQAAEHAEPRRKLRPLKILAPAALACSALLVAVLIRQPDSQSYQTGLHKQEVQLADGSHVVLNVQTSIKVSYSDQQRQIDFIRGQAIFSVAKDPARPFVVDFGQGSVTALGTQFEVYKQSSQTLVSLLEGQVKIKSAHSATAGAQDNEMIVVNQNEHSVPQVSVSDTHLSKVVQSSQAQIEAWKQDRLVFNDTPLALALAEANRYSQSEIKLGEPALADLHISGVFPSNNNSVLLKALEKYYPVRAEKSADGRIILLPKV